MALTTDDLDAVRESVGRRCQRCFTKERILSNGSSSLHVHHVIERNKPGGTDERENLEVLCPRCHKREHVARGTRKPGPAPLPEGKKFIFKGFKFDPEMWDRFEAVTTSGERSLLMRQAVERIVREREARVADGADD